MRNGLYALALGGAVVAAAASVSGSAQAYPPGTSMQVTGTRVGTPQKKMVTYNVTISQAPPGCTLNVKLRGTTTQVTVPAGSTSVSTSITVKSMDGGTASIKVSTASSCTTTEKASTKVRVAPAHLEGDASCKRSGKSGSSHGSKPKASSERSSRHNGESHNGDSHNGDSHSSENNGRVNPGSACAVEAEHYPPNSWVTFTAMKPGSRDVVRTVRTDSKGRATTTFSLPVAGAWAIVGACNGESHTWWIQVKK